MKNFQTISFLFTISQISSKNFIKNVQKPECKNCIYYKPNDFTGLDLSTYNKCLKFGEKNILDGKIQYDVAKYSRNDEGKCGIEGKYFERDDFSQIKYYYYLGKSYTPYIGLIMLVLLLTILSVYLDKNR